MKYLFTLLILSTSFFAHTSNDIEQLRHIKQTLWPQAYRDQNTDLLNQILHAKFQMTDNKGEISTKDNELAAVKLHAWTVENFSYHIERLEIFNQNTAVISGRGETKTYTYRSSNVLIKEDGRWQAILSHVSGFKEK